MNVDGSFSPRDDMGCGGVLHDSDDTTFHGASCSKAMSVTVWAPSYKL